MFGPDVRRSCFQALCIVILSAAVGCGDGPGSDRSTDAVRRAQVVPRAILLISLDTLRADHLGTYGHERFTSPVIDQLAREGVVFEDASSTSPWTLPAHASMLTGLAPIHHDDGQSVVGRRGALQGLLRYGRRIP